jgi:hypothetical protein
MHIPAIAFDRFVAILHPLHYEDRMTPATIGRIIGVLWFVAAATSLPSYVGFATSVVPPQSCIVTFWPMFETVVELSYYVISSSVVAFVYTEDLVDCNAPRNAAAATATASCVDRFQVSSILGIQRSV